jgi:hypothetical protein
MSLALADLRDALASHLKEGSGAASAGPRPLVEGHLSERGGDEHGPLSDGV